MSPTGSLSGRKAQADRNDRVILEAARRVFVADPAAPVSAVAKAAEVGISALYRRYASKEELLQKLCTDGLQTYIACAEAALTDDADAWRSFTGFLGAVVDADVHALTANLAGTFTRTPQMVEQTGHAVALAGELLSRAQAAGEVRADFTVADIPMLLEQLTAVHGAGPERTRELRHRYLALFVDALRPAAAAGGLPGPAPTTAELSSRWTPREG